MNSKFKKICFILVLIGIFLSSASIFAQRSSRVLYCNERDSVSDVLSFPRQATVRKTGSGTVSRLEWRGFIGSDKGNYELRISSYSDFSFTVLTKSKSRNSKWQRVGSGRRAYTATSGGNRYFKYEKVLVSPGFYSNGVDIAILVTPYSRRADVRFSWYTTRCEKSAPRRSTCSWVYEDEMPYNVTGKQVWRCKCGGRTSNARRCGAKPRRFSTLIFPTPNNEYFEWKKYKNDFLLNKRTFKYQLKRAG